MSSFRPAVREALRLRMALEGPSGSGKTITALRIAQGLGGRIAVIDTENRSASRYIGEDFGEGPLAFDVVELDTFEPARLVKLLEEAAEAGYDVVIVDSLSHFWMGEGGMLDAVDNAAKRQSGGNSFAAWKAVKPAERAMWDALIRCRTHLICTLRTKTEWVIEENDRGKKTPRKIGLKAEQREGLEYEFDVVGDLTIDHDFVASKTRCSALDGKAFQRPGADVARILHRWLGSGPIRDEPRRGVSTSQPDKQPAKTAATEPPKGLEALRKELTTRDLLGQAVGVFGDPGGWTAADVESLQRWLAKGANAVGLAARAVRREGRETPAKQHWGPFERWLEDDAAEVMAWRADGYPALEHDPGDDNNEDHGGDPAVGGCGVA